MRYFPSSGKLFPDLRSLVSVLENLSVSLFLYLSLSLVAVVFVALLLLGMEFAPVWFFSLVKHVCIDFSEDDPSRIVSFSIS